MKFLVETSARHMHITEEDFITLFGADAELDKKKDLSQPGEFAATARVIVEGPKSKMNVTILGPFRPFTQVELSLTDARSLGITVPIRESGDIADSTGAKLVGPKGELIIKEGVIAAKRHLHADPESAGKLGVKNKQVVCVKLTSSDRTTIYDDVVVRVNENYALGMHIDTDEANAAGISGNAEGEIVHI